MLTPSLVSSESAEEYEAVIRVELETVLTAAQAKKYARLLVRDNAYDSPGALAGLQLSDMGVPMGHRRIICMALLNGSAPSGQATVSVAPLNATAPTRESQTERQRFRMDWPCGERMPSAQEVRSFLLGLKVYLDQSNRSELAARVWACALDLRAKMLLGVWL